MRQSKESEQHIVVVLEDRDILDICTIGRNKLKTRVKCFGNTLFFDEIPYKELENIKEEKKAIKAMDKYLNKK